MRVGDGNNKGGDLPKWREPNKAIAVYVSVKCKTKRRRNYTQKLKTSRKGKAQSNWSSHLISSLRIKIIIVVSKVSTTTTSS